MKSRFIVACAGSGKTTTIIKEALLASQSGRVLITTFTDENTEEIKRKFVEQIGYVPPNADILPWFTFEIRHLIKPYLLPIINVKIEGVEMVSNESAKYTSQENINHYLSQDNKLYSDKIALLAYKTIQQNKIKVLGRLNQIYSGIFIDEFQDFAGYDLEIVKEFMKNGFPVMIVGDPRQKTYSTHFSTKYRKYNDDKESFIDEKCNKYCVIDKDTLNISYRCPEKIIAYASSLFPEYPVSHSISSPNDTDGVFLVKGSEVLNFIKKESGTVQLRLNAKTHVYPGFRVMTFGKSKGSTFENVLIYPTQDIKNAILSNNFSLISSHLTKCKLYVAMTRAKHRVGIVVDEKDLLKLNNPNVLLWSLT